jgi:hypothetical protein
VDYNIKYLWQQVVAEALLESQPELVQHKVSIAEQAVAQRLRESPTDVKEQLALQNALIALQIFMPRKEREEDSGEQKLIA